MSHKKDLSGSHENASDVQVRLVEGDSASENLEVGSLSEQISEVANENVNESSSGAKSSQKIQSRAQPKQKAAPEERLLLREKLLSHAPKPLAMRREVEDVLLKKKASVERDIRNLSRRQDFDLLSKAVAQLRHLVHQLELVAHASYELLKEIWLRVVHKLA